MEGLLVAAVGKRALNRLLLTKSQQLFAVEASRSNHRQDFFLTRNAKFTIKEFLEEG